MHVKQFGGDMMKAVYDPNKDGIIAYAQLALTGAVLAADIKAAAAIPLSKLVNTVCSETEAAALISAALGAIFDVTLADFQVTPATGTFTVSPENVNDNTPGTIGRANIIGQYAEIDFGCRLAIDQWRIYGHDSNNGNGRWKIEYYGRDLAWHDWVTDIVANEAVWTTMTAETEYFCSKVRLTCTAVDTGEYDSICGELEVYHS